jgi:hypothetical protein
MNIQVSRYANIDKFVNNEYPIYLFTSPSGIQATVDYLIYRIFIIDKLVNIRVSTYLYIHIHVCYMLFNQQQCFIYSTASFSSKLRAKKVEKLGNSS